jgi:rhodanese-related sulfurtransferase
MYCMCIRRAALSIFFLSLFLALGISAQSTHAQLTQDEIDLDAFIIMPEALLYKILNGDDDYVLVDVRLEEEYRAGHIVGAVSIPWEDGTFMELRDELPRNREVIFVSSDGLDALKALRVLRDDEYRGNYDSLRPMSSIEGGMGNWPYREYLLHE